MDASGTVGKDQEIEFNALEGSLSMMSKGLGHHHLVFLSRFLIASTVLNDVLDLCVI